LDRLPSCGGFCLNEAALAMSFTRLSACSAPLATVKARAIDEIVVFPPMPSKTMDQAHVMPIDETAVHI
jgi:hypothetical protein